MTRLAATAVGSITAGVVYSQVFGGFSRDALIAGSVAFLNFWCGMVAR